MVRVSAAVLGTARFTNSTSFCAWQAMGYEGMFGGVSAIYAGIAQVIDEVFGKTILPLGVRTI